MQMPPEPSAGGSVPPETPEDPDWSALLVLYPDFRGGFGETAEATPGPQRTNENAESVETYRKALAAIRSARRGTVSGPTTAESRPPHPTSVDLSSSKAETVRQKAS